MKHPNLPIIGSFKNEHGELFEIYKGEFGYLMAGDETDWEPYNLIIRKDRVYAINEFLLTVDEDKEILKIIKGGI